MNLDALKLFVAVAKRGSFAAVAKDLDVEPSSVSRTISNLESELGVRLFSRTTRTMSLSEAGDLYLSKVETLVDELERARAQAANIAATPSGTLRITASVSYGQTMIVPLLPKFCAAYPGLNIEAVFTDANVDLVADRIDLAVRLAPAIEGDVIATKLARTIYRIVASPHYLSHAPKLERPKDLIAHKTLLFALRSFKSRWIFKDGNGQIEEAPISGSVTLSPASALRDAALAGMGIVLLPMWLVDDEIANGRLVHLLPDYQVTATTFETAVWLVYPSRAYLPGKVRVMIDFLKRELGR
jgi:DNA-binding transcriptional LysR family regulator